MMLYVVLIYLIIFTLMTYGMFRDIFSPTVIIGIMCTLCSFFACLGNANWGVSIPIDILPLYVLGTIALATGELIAVNRGKIVLKNGHKRKFAQRALTENYIPFCYVSVALVYSIGVVFYYSRKLISFAYDYGYTGAAWQSLQECIKNATMYSDFHIGYVLASAYAIFIVFVYIAVQFFVINASLIGWKKAFKSCWYYLLLLVPYVYIQFMQGQRTGILGLIVFGAFIFFLGQSKKKFRKIKVKDLVKYGVTALVSFFIIFAVIGVNTGRIVGSALESIKVYTGSSIVDTANYFNEGGEFNETIGATTLVGLRATISRFIPSINNSKQGTVLHFVRYQNGSASNVYGSFTQYYADFWYVGVILLCLILGFLYRRLYENARMDNASYGSTYIYGYIGYGIIMTPIAECQITSLFSVVQLMHIFFAVIILPWCVNHFAKRPIIIKGKNVVEDKTGSKYATSS